MDRKERSLNKKKEDKKEIINFLLNPLDKGEVISFVVRNISNLYQEFFDSRDLINLVKEDNSFKIFHTLQGMKKRSFLIQILYKNDLIGFIPSIVCLDGKVEDILEYFFKDFPELDFLLKELLEIESIFNKKAKKAKKLYSTALNIVNEDKRLKKLGEALNIAPWGSMISLHIIKTYILLLVGKRKGKTFVSLRKEVFQNHVIINN